MSQQQGYRPSSTVWEKKKSLRTPSISANLGYLLSDYVCIFMCPLVPIVIDHPIRIPLFFLCFLVSARGMRGLECMVHDGSHYNVVNVRREGVLFWALELAGQSKLSRRASDFFVNVSAAYPVFSTVQNYRATHELHHNELGTDKDPDYVRHNELKLDGLDRSGPLRFCIEMTKRIIPYWTSWWRAIGTDLRTFAISSCWHIVFIALVSVAVDLKFALTYWSLGFLLPFVFVLPVLRFIGEAAEHDYSKSSSVAEQTFSNTGWLHKLWFHPHNDGYHTLHHLFADVPHHNLRELNDFVQANDANNFEAYLRNRVNVLQDA